LIIIPIKLFIKLVQTLFVYLLTLCLTNTNSMKYLIIITIMCGSLNLLAQNQANPHHPGCETYKTFNLNPNYIETHDNGLIQQSGYIINGVLEGEWKEFDSSGNVTAVANYQW